MHAGEAGLGALPSCGRHSLPSSTMQARRCLALYPLSTRCCPSSTHFCHDRLPLQPIHAAIRSAAPHLKSLRIEGSTGHEYTPLPPDARSTLTQLTRLELTKPAAGLEDWMPPALEELVMPRWGRRWWFGVREGGEEGVLRCAASSSRGPGPLP
jgi:hypothetical protein